MIVLVCGPSGSGKTTLLTNIAMHTKNKIIEVIVSRNNPRTFSEYGKKEISQLVFERIKGTFDHLYQYDDSVYGYALREENVSITDYVFLDYPGEYPDCNELKKIPWRGIVVLPPSKDELVTRLRLQRKEHRIPSAVEEYDAIIEELNDGKYPKQKWKVFYSRDAACMSDMILDITHKRLFG